MNVIYKNISTIIFLQVFFFYSFGQAPAIAWQNTIGGSAGEQFRSIVQTKIKN